MLHEYTRQRQGRDFSIINHLRSGEMSVEGNYNNIDDVIGNAPPKDGSEEKKSMLEKLEYFRTETERRVIPIDGCEPPLDTSVAERAR